MNDELERVNREASRLVATEIEKGIRRAIVSVSGESVARQLEDTLRTNQRLCRELGICQDALRDIAAETGTPYARTAREALAKVTYVTSEDTRAD